MHRVNFYIDGFNLYYGVLKRTPYKWLVVSKLSQPLLPTDTIQSIKFFTANVSARPHDPHLPVRQQICFRALSSNSKCNTSRPDGRRCCHANEILSTDECRST